LIPTIDITMKTIAKNICGLACALLLAGTASSQTYSIDWHGIGGGGGTSTGNGFSMSATIGDFDAGTLTGGSYTLDGGYWTVNATDESPEVLFNNTNGVFSGVQEATTTGWLAGKLCLGSQSFGLESVTLLLSSQQALGSPQPSTVRLQIFANDPVSDKPSTNLGVVMNLSGTSNPISLPLGTDEIHVKWIPASAFTLAANTCYWVVLSVDDGVNVWETASVTMPTGAAATFGRASSINAGSTWSNPDNASNLKMLVEGTEFAPLIINNVSVVGNTLHFNFLTNVGKSYAVESRTALATGVWVGVPGALQTSIGPALEVSLPIDPSQPQQFFRVKQLP
jgi:hypothetical protein